MFLEDITGTSQVTGQQVVIPVRDDSLSGGTVIVSGEGVSEEPGTEWSSLIRRDTVLCWDHKSFGCLELCLYVIREMTSATP